MLATAAQAQGRGNWPDRPVRLLVGFSAGGPTDFAARSCRIRCNIFGASRW
ncbi:hypothetical protein ACFQU2_12500 [Siccirubricoccus deserti]